MHPRLKLHLINHELDNTNPNGPYRVWRQRLNREKKRIIRILEHRDPRWFAVVGKGGIPGHKMENYKLKKQIVSILDILEQEIK